jgi:hypothetical protein
MTHAAGRDDYDQMVQFKGIAEGEPYFMLRGQDAIAGDAIRAWVMLASKRGVAPAVLEQALRQADRLDAWPTKKLPDADHLTDAEQKDLVYCLSRRAWDARDDALDFSIFMAEQRAETAARAAYRPLTTAIAALARDLFDEAKEAAFEAQRAIDRGDRDGAHRLAGKTEALARAHGLVDALRSLA